MKIGGKKFTWGGKKKLPPQVKTFLCTPLRVKLVSESVSDFAIDVSH